MKAAAEWVNPGDLVPWDQNPRINDDAVAQIAASICRFGFASPIVARSEDLRVIAGHTRLKAAQLLPALWADSSKDERAGWHADAAALAEGRQGVPVRLLDVSITEANALALADNKLGEIADWDDEVLADVLDDLHGLGVELDGLGWDADALDDFLAYTEPEPTGSIEYTDKITAPAYEPKMKHAPLVSSLYSRDKTEQLVTAIEAADVPDEVRAFLLAAAQRHTVFDYGMIAEFYAHAPATTQRLMEESALVIIDFDKAIEMGFVRMTKDLKEIFARVTQ